MTITVVLQRTSESVLRVVALLHRHRWDVEQLMVQPGDAPGLQRISLRVSVDGLVRNRVLSALRQLIDVIDVEVLDNAA